MRLIILCFITGIMVFTGCIEHRPTDVVYTAPKKSETTKVKPKLKGLNVYEGTIPCSGCSGVEQHLVLRGDSMGAFRLTEVYKNASEDGDEVIVTTGTWKSYISKKAKEKKQIFYLSEGSIKDSTRTHHYELRGKQLIQLDLNGRKVADSSGKYILNLIRKSN